jgi:RNA polymerase sigma factor (sigma-70 family)
MALTLSMTSTPPACGEHVLVAAARAGDDRAFGELYARYQSRISAFILSKVHDHGRAEDIAQEVFISALRRLRSSDQQIAFKPWIYEIAKNACIDEFRRGTRTREVPFEADEEFAGGHRALRSVAPTPAAAVESKQRLDDLKGAFGGLSDSHHKMLVMREFEGLSYDEIGDRLGMTRQMVESGLFRARRKLSDEYSELASGRRCEQVQSAIEAGPARSLRSLGIRERRRFSRHLSHCQMCRRRARLAGVDEALFQTPSITKKIAAMLPFPVWRGGGAAAGAGSGSHHLAAVESLQNAARIAEPASSSVTIGQAAAAAAALAIAGAGGGLVGGLTHRHANRSATAVLTAAHVRASHPARAKHATVTRTVAPSAPPTILAGARPSRSGPGSASRSSQVARISSVSAVPAVPAAARSPRPVAAGSGTPASGVPASNSSPNRPAATTPAHAVVRALVAGAGVADPVHSTVAGAVHSTVRGTVHSTVAGAVHSTVSSAGPIASSATQPLLPAAPAQTPKQTVSDLLSQ